MMESPEGAEGRGSVAEAIKARLVASWGPEEYATSRALNFAGAGINLAFILLIAQIRSESVALKVALLFSSLALPAWLGMAISTHLLLTMRIDYASIWHIGWVQRTNEFVYGAVVLLLFGTIWCVLFDLWPPAAAAFASACATGVVVLRRVVLVVGRVWAAREFGAVQPAPPPPN